MARGRGQWRKLINFLLVIILSLRNKVFMSFNSDFKRLELCFIVLCELYCPLDHELKFIDATGLEAEFRGKELEVLLFDINLRMKGMIFELKFIIVVQRI